MTESNRFIARCQHRKRHSTLRRGLLRFNGVSITLHKNRTVYGTAVYVIFGRTVPHGGTAQPWPTMIASRRRVVGRIALPLQRLQSGLTYIPCLRRYRVLWAIAKPFWSRGQRTGAAEKGQIAY